MTEGRTSTISVVIPFFNDDRWFPEAIASLLAQRRVPDEVIVVDDASADGRAETLKEPAGRFRVIRMEQNSGPGAARQAGLLASSGDLVGFLDADDRWTPDYLAACEAVLLERPTLPAVYTGLVKFHPDGTRREFCNKPRQLDVREAIVRFHAYPGQAMLFRRSALLEMGGWNTGRLIVDDWELVVRMLARFGPIPLIPRPLVEYRVHHEGGRLNSQGIRKLRRWFRTVRANRELLERHFGKGAVRRRFAQAVRDRADHYRGLQSRLYALGSRLFGRPLDRDHPPEPTS